MKKEGKK